MRFSSSTQSQTHYLHFNWQLVRKGHWEREIDEAERFYTCLAKSYEGSDRMCFAITGFVSVSVDITNGTSGHDVEEALRKAWLRLRYNHPTIASRVDYNSAQEKYIKSYTALHPDHVDFQTESWLSQTFVSIVPNMTGLDWCNSDPIAPKIPTLFVITPPYTNGSLGLVLRSPHNIIAEQIIAVRCSLSCHPSAFRLPELGSENVNLSPPLRIAANIPPVLLDQQEHLQSILSNNANLRQNAELLSVPFTEGQVIPGKHQRTALILSTTDTARVLQACKELGATVTHVYHASIALNLRDLQSSCPQERIARYINYSLINERPNCASPYNSVDHAVAVYHTVSGNSLALDLTIPSAERSSKDYPGAERSQEEFRGLVNQVKVFYTSIRNCSDNLALAPSIFSTATPHVSNPGSRTPLDRPVPAPNPSPSVSISSMGKLDNIIAPQHGTFTAKHPWVTGEELGTGIGVFLGTWQGNLQLSAAYNEAWHDREEVRGFLESCCEIVWRGLGLGSGSERKPKVEWMH
ncbi:hypothetical protein EJ07DRAFT_166448 [Lizonia empirigonia]|nr:hypothetical protein EJ07DRAFT_166448 [Lizonia empirigonia]